MDTILSDLDDISHTVRAEAIEQLRKSVKESGGHLLSSNLKKLFEMLQLRLQDSNWNVAHKCTQLVCDIIPRFGPDLDVYMAMLLPPLIKNVGESKVVVVRKASIEALLTYIKASKNLEAIIGVLISRGMEHEDARVRQEAISSIQLLFTRETDSNKMDIRKLVDVLLSRTRDASENVAQAADKALWHLRGFRDDVPAVVKTLSSSQHQFYQVHLERTAKMHVPPSPSSIASLGRPIPGSSSGLGSSHPPVDPPSSFHTSVQLEFGFVPARIVGGLRDTSGANWRVRTAAVEEFRKVISNHQGSFSFLKDSTAFTPFWSFLVSLLEDSNFRISLTALQSVGDLIIQMGSDIRPHIDLMLPKLVEVWGDSKIVVRQETTRVMTSLAGLISPKAMIQKLTQPPEFLDHKKQQVREEILNFTILTLLSHSRAVLATSSKPMISQEFDFPSLVNAIITRPLSDSRRPKLKFLAVETLAVIHSLIGSKIFSLLSGLQSRDPETYQLLQERFEKPVLPVVAEDGHGAPSVEHPLLTVAASPRVPPSPMSTVSSRSTPVGSPSKVSRMPSHGGGSSGGKGVGFGDLGIDLREITADAPVQEFIRDPTDASFKQAHKRVMSAKVIAKGKLPWDMNPRAHSAPKRIAGYDSNVDQDVEGEDDGEIDPQVKLEHSGSMLSFVDDTSSHRHHPLVLVRRSGEGGNPKDPVPAAPSPTPPSALKKPPAGFVPTSSAASSPKNDARRRSSASVKFTGSQEGLLDPDAPLEDYISPRVAIELDHTLLSNPNKRKFRNGTSLQGPIVNLPSTDSVSDPSPSPVITEASNANNDIRHQNDSNKASLASAPFKIKRPSAFKSVHESGGSATSSTTSLPPRDPKLRDSFSPPPTVPQRSFAPVKGPSSVVSSGKQSEDVADAHEPPHRRPMSAMSDGSSDSSVSTISMGVSVHPGQFATPPPPLPNNSNQQLKKDSHSQSSLSSLAPRVKHPIGHHQQPPAAAPEDLGGLSGVKSQIHLHPSASSASLSSPPGKLPRNPSEDEDLSHALDLQTGEQSFSLYAPKSNNANNTVSPLQKKPSVIGSQKTSPPSTALPPSIARGQQQNANAAKATLPDKRQEERESESESEQEESEEEDENSQEGESESDGEGESESETEESEKESEEEEEEEPYLKRSARASLTSAASGKDAADKLAILKQRKKFSLNVNTTNLTDSFTPAQPPPSNSHAPKPVRGLKNAPRERSPEDSGFEPASGGGFKEFEFPGNNNDTPDNPFQASSKYPKVVHSPPHRPAPPPAPVPASPAPKAQTTARGPVKKPQPQSTRAAMWEEPEEPTHDAESDPEQDPPPQETTRRLAPSTAAKKQMLASARDAGGLKKPTAGGGGGGLGTMKRGFGSTISLSDGEVDEEPRNDTTEEKSSLSRTLPRNMPSSTKHRREGSEPPKLQRVPSSSNFAKSGAVDLASGTRELRTEELDPVDNPEREVASAMSNLKSESWSDQFDAINMVRRLTVHHARTAIVPRLHPILLDIFVAADNLRSQISRSALVCITELLKFVKKGMDSELDAIVPVLLKKTSDTNRFLASEAEAGLQAMVENATESRTLAALMANASHKNAAIRSKVAQFVGACVQHMGSRVSSCRELDRIVVLTHQFLGEGSNETRSHGKAIAYHIFNGLGGDDAEFTKTVRRALGSEPQVRKVQEALEKAIKFGIEPATNSRAATSKPLSRTTSTASNNDDTWWQPKDSEFSTTPTPHSRTTSVTSAAGDISGRMKTAQMPPRSRTASTVSEQSVPLPPQSAPKTRDGSVTRKPASAKPVADPDEFESLQSIYSAMGASDWKERLDGVTQLVGIVEKYPSQICSRTQAVLDNMIPRLGDPNSKVNVFALQSFLRILPTFQGYIEPTLPRLVGAVYSSLANSNSQVRAITTDILDEIANACDIGPLCQTMAQQAPYAKPPVRPILFQKLAEYSRDAFIKKPALVTKHVVPLAFAQWPEAKGDSKASLVKLFQTLYSCMGDALFENAGKLSSSEIQKIKDFL